jgi:alpha-beta hydrolase superfamily lysophospholipase
VGSFLKMTHEFAPGIPLFMMGQSLGGLVVLEYVLHHPEGLSGVIAAAPALSAGGLSPLLIGLSRVLSRIAPRLSMPTGLEVEALSRDLTVVQVYRGDPLIHDRGTPRAAVEGLEAIERSLTRAAGLQVPLLVVHGEADRIVPVEASKVFFDRVTYPDRERRVYEGGYHELHNDLNQEEFLADLGEWLERHL